MHATEKQWSSPLGLNFSKCSVLLLFLTKLQDTVRFSFRVVDTKTSGSQDHHGTSHTDYQPELQPLGEMLMGTRRASTRLLSLVTPDWNPRKPSLSAGRRTCSDVDSSSSFVLGPRVTAARVFTYISKLDYIGGLSIYGIN